MNEQQRNEITSQHLKEQLDSWERHQNSFSSNCQIKKLKWRLKYDRRLESRKSQQELHKTYLSQVGGTAI